MLDISRFEGKKECAELVGEVKRLRKICAMFADVAELVTAKAEPLNPESVKCDQICRKRAEDALNAWRKL